MASQSSASRSVNRRLLERFWRRLRSDKMAMVSFIVVFVILLAALFAPWVVPHDPLAIDPPNRLQPPDRNHLLGTDEMGRDVFSRVIFGTRVSLKLAGIVVGFAVSLGLVVGVIAGYVGGNVDQVIMRITDVFLAFPDLILAMAFSATFGPSVENAGLALGLVWWPGYARMVRGQILAVKSAEYVEASRALGAGHLRIIFRHMLPNCFDPVAVRITMTTGYAILAGASLSFVGLGAQPPTPEWGLTVAIARGYMLTAWWYPTLVGLCILVTVQAFIMAGDVVQEALNVQIRDL